VRLSRCRDFDVRCHSSRIACSVPEANDEAWALLRRMKDDLRLVSSELFGAIKQWFVTRCPDWTAEVSTIDDDGACAADSTVRLLAVRKCEHARFEQTLTASRINTGGSDRNRARRARQRHRSDVARS
jgi:hypothetical protein